MPGGRATTRDTPSSGRGHLKWPRCGRLKWPTSVRVAVDRLKVRRVLAISSVGALEPESVVVRQLFHVRFGTVVALALADLEPGRAGVFFVGGVVERGACTAPRREWYGGAVSFLRGSGWNGGAWIEFADRDLVSTGVL